MPKATLAAGAQITEAILRKDQSLDAIRSAIGQTLRAQAIAENPENTYPSCWVCDLFPPDIVIYSMAGEYYQATYTVDTSSGDPIITLGAPTEVDVAYVTADEGGATEAAQDLTSDLIPLLERAIGKDGTFPLKVIQAGWGSSGYYPADVLQRDGPKVFPSGVQMHIDHPSLSEARERPERSLQTLAAVTVTPAEWQENGPAGPGLYAQAKAFGNYAPLIEELSPHIGVSIRAAGHFKPGEAEGRKGPVITSLERGDSIDFVTRAGAGGKVLQLMESARSGPSTPPREERRTMREPIPNPTPGQIGDLQESLTRLQEENRRMRERELLRDGADLIQRALAGYPLHEMSRSRLAEDLVAHLPLTEAGEIDREKLTTQIQEAAQREADYLSRVVGAGQVRGMGSSVVAEELTEAQARTRLEDSFRLSGMSESAAKLAASGGR